MAAMGTASGGRVMATRGTVSISALDQSGRLVCKLIDRAALDVIMAARKHDGMLEIRLANPPSRAEKRARKHGLKIVGTDTE